MRLSRYRRTFLLFLTGALALAVGAAILPRGPGSRTTAAAGCPAGYRAVDERELAAEMRGGTAGRSGEVESELERSVEGYRDDGRTLCLSNKHPEPYGEIAAMQAQRTARAAAPFATVAPGAFRAALAQRSAMIAAAPRVRGSNGVWRPLGKGPLISNDPRFDEVNGLGLAKLAGRIDSLDYDPVGKRLFALIGTGGVWMSRDRGASWRSIGDPLPTQTNGALAWTPAGGGTLVVVSGEPLMGGNTYTGLGAYWSNDLGRTWHHARGVPDGAMGFQVAVDPTNPREVYVATSMGLYRSTDTGKSFTNVALPTGKCAGKTGFGRCQFANFVTDVVIQAPGGKTGVDGGIVLAAVGYRAGKRTFPNGKQHSPNNGLYRSASGKPGTFDRLDVSGDGATPLGFAPEQNIGRTELGAAIGEQQDHNYVYAIVEDAELFNGGVPSIDVPEDPGADDEIIYNTTFNGIYVSDDFGESWTRMADTAEVAENPTTHSGLAGTGQLLLFAPGVQAWYNMWIKPDPTRQDDAGVPTRLAFGLEEVWANRCDNPQNTPDQPPCDAGEYGDFEVRGPYFADEACLLLDTGTQQCPAAEDLTNPGTTTHPDQHDAIWLPRGDGGVSFVVGNDGGSYVQELGPESDISPERWGKGDNDGFHTLLPYNAEVSKDGTVWYGLQDNGSGKITPKDEKQYMTFGGDGFFVAVDPNDSKYAWSETTFADMRVTTDGGKSWRTVNPGVTRSQFSNPFVMDPKNANHLLTAGNQVVETIYGPNTQPRDPDLPDELQEDKAWQKVFELGTHPEGGATNRMSAVDLQGDAAYVGYCGVCDVLNNWDPGFHNGLATNVGGSKPPKRMTSQGWHHAAAKGLPNRWISSIAIDPKDSKTVYVTLGGYANREWVPPGSYLDTNKDLGKGHVFRSTDAGKTFTNISGNLPNTSANWVELHQGQLLVGTDIGVFLSSDTKGTLWAALADGLPAVPISTIRNHPGDPREVVVATFGRGVYAYRFPAPPKKPEDDPKKPDKDPEPEPPKERDPQPPPPDDGPPPAEQEDTGGAGLATTGAQILGLLLLAGALIGTGLGLTRRRQRWPW